MRPTLGEIQTFVSNLHTAREFYADTLGLELVGESDRYLVFDVGEVKFIVMPGARRGTPRTTYGGECATVLCLSTDDIERDYEALRRKGVRFFSKIRDVPQGRFVAFQDPDGNLLELIQKPGE